MRFCMGCRWPCCLTRPLSPASGWMWWTGACCFSRKSAEGKAGFRGGWKPVISDARSRYVNDVITRAAIVAHSKRRTRFTL